MRKVTVYCEEESHGDISISHVRHDGALNVKIVSPDGDKPHVYTLHTGEKIEVVPVAQGDETIAEAARAIIRSFLKEEATLDDLRAFVARDGKPK